MENEMTVTSGDIPLYLKAGSGSASIGKESRPGPDHKIGNDTSHLCDTAYLRMNPHLMPSDVRVGGFAGVSDRTTNIPALAPK